MEALVYSFMCNAGTYVRQRQQQEQLSSSRPNASEDCPPKTAVDQVSLWLFDGKTAAIHKTLLANRVSVAILDILNFS